MAKIAAAQPTKPLAGRKVAFVGKFGYYQDKYQEPWVKSAGGVVVSPDGTFDYLVYGAGRGGKPPGDVAKIEKRLPNVVSLSFAELAKLVLPTPAELVARIKSSEPGYEYWDSLNALVHTSGAGTLDLAGTDFRGAYLSGAKLGWATLSGCDFTNTDCRYADLSHQGQLIEGAKFDGAKLYAATLRTVKGCSFRGADLKETWADSATYDGCDFRDASLIQIRGGQSKFTDCDFRGAGLSGAELDLATFTACDFTGADLSRLHAHKAKFIDAKFERASLYRADLREASLKNADLRNAHLREAVFGGADLTGANVDGADFAGAVLTGATLAGVDFSKAKNYTAPVARTAGPKVTEFAQAASGAKNFTTSADAELGTNEHTTMSLRVGPRGINASARYYRDGTASHDWITAPTLAQGLLNMADRWPNATLRLDTVTATGSPTVRGAKLKALAVAAWAEAFGVPLKTEADLAEQKATQEAAAIQTRDALMAKVREQGVKAWNAMDYRERARIDLRGADLHGAQLVEFDATMRDLTGARFAGANLTIARLYGSTFHGADFAGANLTAVSLHGCKCEKASFVGATMNSANLSGAKLQGADFTGADLTDAKLEKAQFDERTKFPASYKIPADAVWKGKGLRPGVSTTKAAAVGSVDFGTFFKNLAKKVDPSRIAKATAMLKAERFQLFADVTDAALVGVVKSQSSKELVYSCRLAADGQFGCGTQNLKPCGGLQGALCKHLLVLVVGLAKTGTLDAALAGNWVGASKAHKPSLDKDAMSETFLKYKGAEAGDIDWRPTETVPEDFYAM